MKPLHNVRPTAKPDETMTVAEVRAAAQRWYDTQVAMAARCLGPMWEVHRDWITDYVKAELRERLIALGWTPT